MEPSCLTKRTATLSVIIFCIGAVGCITSLTSCRYVFFDKNEVSIDLIQEKNYEPTVLKLPALGQSTTLYLDHSTCVIDANRNSPVFKALKGQLGLYTDTLCLIKGSEIVVIENTDKSPTSTDVFNIINGINNDIPFANIGGAIKKICEGNSQAILITDCEYFDKGGKNQDGFPYLSGAFINWIKKGHCIYIVTEPYREMNRGNVFEKKRFYFIFTNDKMQTPISNNLLNELQQSLQDSVIGLFKLTNSDIVVKRQGKMFSEDLTISDVEGKEGFDYVELYDEWDDIRTYVMKLDEYGEALDNDEGTNKANPIPLVQNLIFEDGANYKITDIEVVATNITAEYVALNDENTASSTIEIKDAFFIDKQALQEGHLNVFVTEKVFDFLTDEYGGNLIRLDFVVTKANVKPYNSDMFIWQSIYSPDKATCVLKSIDNALHEATVFPTADNRRLIHTIFLKTQAYK